MSIAEKMGISPLVGKLKKSREFTERSFHLLKVTSAAEVKVCLLVCPNIQRGSGTNYRGNGFECWRWLSLKMIFS